MTGGRGAQPRAAYFFLSYAHTPPTEHDGSRDADGAVGLFYDDLSAAVAHRGAAGPALDIGFCDRALRPGSDWGAEVRGALGRAEVFVPLHAPRYFGSTLAGREWTLFHRRLLGQGVADPGRRVVPVLWTPLPPGFPNPTGVDAPPEHTRIPGYREDGLQTLRRLSRRRGDYETVVDRVAAAVVDLARGDPVAPGPVPVVDDSELLFPTDDADPRFTVLIAAPGAAARCGADAGVRTWRPFGASQQLALADYAEIIASRFGFACRARALTEKAGELGRSPGIVLIDERLGADAKGRALLEAAAANLPGWALPVLVRTGADPERAGPDPAGSGLPARFAPDGIAPFADAPRHAGHTVTSIEEFEAAFPILVTDAARLFLRQAPVVALEERRAARPRIFPQPPD